MLYKLSQKAGQILLKQELFTQSIYQGHNEV